MATSAPPFVRLLLCGDVLGAFDALFDRVAAVNAKAGPFDLLLCTGQFFAPADDDCGDVPERLRAYVDGSAQPPVRTLFVGGYGRGAAATLAALAAASEAAEAAAAAAAGKKQQRQQQQQQWRSGLSYLGRAGVRTLEGLNVAFLDGTAPRAPTLMHLPFVAPAPATAATAAAAGGGAEPAAGAANGGVDAAAPGADGEQAAEAKPADAAPVGDSDAAAAAAGAAAPAEAGDAAPPPAAKAEAEAAAAAGTPQEPLQQERELEVDRLLLVPPTPTLPLRFYASDDVARLRRELQSLPGDVDLLLTCEWPTGVLHALPEDAAAAAPQPALAGAAAAELAIAARPRYHAAGGGRCAHYARPPYENPNLGVGPRATRFLGLAAAVAVAGSSSGGKPKFLHALALPPASALPLTTLAELPPGCTPSPYVAEAAAAVRAMRAAGGKRPAPGGFGGGDAADGGGGGAASWLWSQPKRGRGGGGGGAGGQKFTPWGRPGVDKDAACCVWVGNLSYEVALADVEELFSAAGEVCDVRRGANPSTGRAQPYCHVQFTEPGAVAAALRLDGTDLLGRQLRVSASTQLAPAAAAMERAYHHGEGEFPPPPPPGGGGRGGARGGRGGRGGGGRHQHPHPHQHPHHHAAEPPAPCWFCLSNDAADTALVVSVGADAYVALDRGPVGPTHALVVPIEHAPSWAGLPPAAAAEVGRYVACLARAAAADGKALVGFERHLQLASKGGNHMHLNTLAVPADAAASAATAFRAAAMAAGIDELVPVPAKAGAAEGDPPQLDVDALRGVVGPEGEYFLALLPDGSGLVAALQPGARAPFQLGRQVLAALLGEPKRADWRACTHSGPGEEEAAADAFRAHFGPHDLIGGGAEAAAAAAAGDGGDGGDAPAAAAAEGENGAAS